MEGRLLFYIIQVEDLLLPFNPIGIRTTSFAFLFVYIDRQAGRQAAFWRHSMQNKVYIVQSDSDLRDCFHVLKELRNHLDFESFSSIYRSCKDREQFELAALRDNKQIVAVMGFRFITDFVRGKHLYIDDLVTISTERSKGHGAALLFYAEEIAKKSNCSGLRLCAVLENESGIKFYERNGWTKRAYAFTKKIDSI